MATYANRALYLASNGQPVTLVSTDSVSFDLSSYTLELNDDTASVFQILESTGQNPYLVIGTGSSAQMDFGNAVDNPDFNFLGSGAVNISGNLVVSGTLSGTGTISFDGVDNSYLLLNASYTSDAPLDGGVVINYDPTTTTDTAAAGGFATTSTLITTGSATFSAGDIVLITGADTTDNNGLFEVLSHAGTTLTIDTTPVLDFVETAFVVDATDVSAQVTKTSVSVIRADTDGVWEVGSGSDNTLAYIDIPLNLQQSYDNAPTVTLSDSVGDLVITADDAGASADLIVTDSGGDYLRTDTTNNTLDLGSAANVVDFVGSSVVATGNPTLDFGSGQADFDGNLDANNGLDVTGADLTVGGSLFSVAVSDGDIITRGSLRLGEISAPTNVANTGFVYTKDDGGDTELYFLDGGGNETQLTADGTLNEAAVRAALAVSTGPVTFNNQNLGTIGELKLDDNISLVLGTDDDVTLSYSSVGDSYGFVPAADASVFIVASRQQMARASGSPMDLSSSYPNVFQAEGRVDTGAGADDVEVIEAVFDNSGGQTLLSGQVATGVRSRMEGHASDNGAAEYWAFDADDFTDNGSGADASGLHVGIGYFYALNVESGRIWLPNSTIYVGDPFNPTPYGLGSGVDLDGMSMRLESASATADMAGIDLDFDNSAGTALTTGTFTGLDIDLDGNASDGAGSAYFGVNVGIFSSGGGSAASTGINVDTGWGVGVQTDAPIHIENSTLRLGETSTPTNVADYGFLYTKDDSGDTELYYLDDGGVEVQLTADGTLNSVEVRESLSLSTGTVDINGESIDAARVITFDTYCTYDILTLDGSAEYLQLDGYTPTIFNTGDWTIETWVYVENMAAASTQQIFDLTNGVSTSEQIRLNFYADGDILLQHVETFSVTNFREPSGISNQTWAHLAARRSGDFFDVMVDGVSVGNFTTSDRTTGITRLTIGAARSGVAQLGGKLSRIGFYNRALSDEECIDHARDRLRPYKDAPPEEGWLWCTGPNTEPDVVIKSYYGEVDVPSIAVDTGDLTQESATIPTSLEEGALYVKEEGFDAELRYVDNHGRDFQLTLDGALNPRGVDRYPLVETSEFDVLSFDGGADYAQQTSYTDTIFSTGDWAIELWVKSDVTGTFMVVLALTDGTSFDDAIRIDILNTEELRISHRELASSDLLQCAFPTDMDFHHVLLQREGNDLSLWLDGFQRASLTTSKRPSPLGRLTLAGSRSGTALFNGSLSRVSFYNRVLTQIEIEDHAESHSSSYSFGTSPDEGWLHQTGVITDITTQIDASFGTTDIPTISIPEAGLTQEFIAAEADTGWVYTKDVSGGTELHYLDDSGGETQLTNAGLLNSTGNTVEITTTPYTVSVDEGFILVNMASDVAPTVNLPAGDDHLIQDILFKDSKGNAATRNITLVPDGSETIDGASSFVLDSDYVAVRLKFYGTNWSAL